MSTYFNPRPGDVPLEQSKKQKEADQRKLDLQRLDEEARLIKARTDSSGKDFEQLARTHLGSLTQFNQSQKAQEQLARQQAMSASQGAQRALAGRLAAQGVRGGAAAAAQMGALNQGAALQAQIGQQMIAQRADKEQELRNQLLSAILAGKQFGNAQAQQQLANLANLEAARLARK